MPFIHYVHGILKDLMNTVHIQKFLTFIEEYLVCTDKK